MPTRIANQPTWRVMSSAETTAAAASTSTMHRQRLLQVAAALASRVLGLRAHRAMPAALLQWPRSRQRLHCSCSRFGCAIRRSRVLECRCLVDAWCTPRTEHVSSLEPRHASRRFVGCASMPERPRSLLVASCHIASVLILMLLMMMMLMFVVPARIELEVGQCNVCGSCREFAATAMP
jgi:hypothetical protein